MNFRCLYHSALAAALLLSAAPARAEEEVEIDAEVIPFDAMWDWLMILEPDSLTQVDPVTVDPDFLETWTTPAYNGPAFQRGAAPLSYGGLDFLTNENGPPGTVMALPASNSRGTVYCRTTFFVPGELTNAKLEFLIDDGFILYLDGARWASANMGMEATSAFTQMSSVFGTEFALSSTTTGPDGVAPLAPLSPGVHTLHLSLHNFFAVSSDLGFMLRLTGDLRRIMVPTPPTLTAEPSAPSLDGSPRFLLRAKDLDPSAAAVVLMSTDLSQWIPLFESPPAPERTELALDLPATARRRFFRLAQ